MKLYENHFSRLIVFLYSIYSLGVNGITFSLASYKKDGLRPFFDAIRDHFGHCVVHFCTIVLTALIIVYIIPFYLSYQSIISVVIAMIMVWICILLFMAMAYYYPLCLSMEKDRPIKTLKKAFIVLFDNLGFSFFLTIKTLISFVLTVILATIVPGLGGISLSRSGAVRILMLKYDYLELHPETKKKDINWEDLLFEEKELIGPRTLKNMIFPWKD
ncbi:MAG: hypothetical protein HUK24_04790 [Sphaerochaetaceae bacterium]|nr:hypothetical protein [Sphaerochaetaceae bacterium]